MAKLAINPGTTSLSVDVFIRDTSVTTGAGLTGLVYNTGSLTAYYHRPGSAATVISLVTLASATAAYSSGGFIAIDGTNLPGWYRLDLPNAVIASGVRFAGVMLKGAANMEPCNIELDLTNDANVTRLSGTTQTARDIGASVLLSPGTGTGQIVLTSGVVSANATQEAGVIILARVTGTAQAGTTTSLTLQAGATSAQVPLGSLVRILTGSGAGGRMKVASQSGMGTGTPIVTGPVGWTWSAGTPGVSSTYDVDPDDGLIPVQATTANGRLDVNVGSMSDDVLTANALNTNAAAEIRDALLAAVIEGTTTLQQSLRLANAVLGGKASGHPAGPAFRDLADTKNRVSAVLDISGNRTSVTRDLT